METSYHLGLEGAEWYADFLLRERDDGELDALPPSERLERYAEYMRRRGIDSFYAAPPGGESMAHLCLRLKWVLDTLHRECENKRVIIVCHGEVMWGFRILIERIPQHRFLKLREYTDPRYQMHNCQIIHYTRRDPSGSGEAVTPYVKWVRSVCPWNETLSSTGWQTIERPRYSNDDLRELVEQTPRLVNA